VERDRRHRLQEKQEKGAAMRCHLVDNGLRRVCQTLRRGVFLFAGSAYLGMISGTTAIVGAEGAERASADGTDKVATAKGDLLITPIQHATLVLRWDGKTIYVDPVGGAARFDGFPAPDIILLTDVHGDHMDAATVKAVAKEKTIVVAPKAVAEGLRKADDSLGKLETKVLAAGEKATVGSVKVEAVFAYNTTEERKKFHEKGRGNGYILDLSGTRIYISGDTEDIPEMRKLQRIDVAFLCMNLPYTMTVEQAASATLEFRPKIVYPYHSRGSDTKKFQSLVEAGSKGIEVRLRDWYAKR